MKRLWLAIGMAIILVVLGFIFWLPVPEFLTRQIPILIEAQLPLGWDITRWDFKKYNLAKLKKGELPHINLELSNKGIKVPISVELTWNQNLESPEVVVDFELRVISEKFQTTNIKGKVFVQAKKNFVGLDSWVVEVAKHPYFQVNPYGKFKNLTLFIAQPKGDKFSGHFFAEEMDLLIEERGATMKLVNVSSAFVYDFSKESFLSAIQSLTLVFDALNGKYKDYIVDISDASLDLLDRSEISLEMKKTKGFFINEGKQWQATSNAISAKGLVNLEAKDPNIKEFELTTPQLSLKEGDKEVAIDKINFKANGSLKKANLVLDIKSMGAIWGEDFYSLSKGLLLNLRKKGENYSANVKRILEKSLNANAKCYDDGCSLSLDLASNIGKDIERYQEFYPDFPGLPIDVVGDWAFKGSLWLKNDLKPAWHTFAGDLTLLKAKLVSKVKTWTLSGIDMNFPISGKGETKASLSVANVQWKKFKGGVSINSWPWWFRLSDSAFGFSLKKINFLKDLDFLKLEDIEFKKINKNSLYAQARLGGEIHNLGDFLDKACLVRKKSAPPMSLSFDYPKIVMDEKKLELGGETLFKSFSGKAVVKDLKVYKWNTKVPETQFQFEAKNFLLEPLGKWLGFGKMRGTLEAFAKDVVMQATLPTQFRAKFSLEPNNSDKEVVFSSRAMQNFAQLFTPEDYSTQIPGWMQWFIFGWPSDLIGGYNIQYAGLSFYSKEGSILLETLDPPDVVAKERNHFLLYGYRFKIPLSSWSYPVVLDGPGFSQFVSHVYYQLLDLQKSHEGLKEKGAADESENWCEYSLDGDAS